MKKEGGREGGRW